MYNFDYKSSESSKFSPKESLGILVLFLFGGYFLSSFLSIIIVLLPSKGFSMEGVMSLASQPELMYENSRVLLGMQGVIMMVAMIACPILMLQLIEKKDISYMHHPKALFSAQLSHLLLGILILLASYPCILFLREFISEWILNGIFGQFGSDMLAQEKTAEKLILKMLEGSSPLDIGLAIFVVAVLPAFAEELVFRGLMQNIFIKMTQIPWLGILITSLIFSAVHFSLTDFITRAILGFILGWVYYQSKLLWIPMIIHFLNNFVSIAAIMAVPVSERTTDLEPPISWYWATTGLLITLILGYYLYKQSTDYFLTISKGSNE